MRIKASWWLAIVLVIAPTGGTTSQSMPDRLQYWIGYNDMRRDGPRGQYSTA